MEMEIWIRSLILFTKHYLHEVILSVVYRLNMNALGGVKNRIKVIEGRDYGYRNADYYFLKIKAACSGKARRAKK